MISYRQEKQDQNTSPISAQNTSVGKMAARSKKDSQPAQEATHIEIYLFCQALHRRELKGDIEYFFNQGLDNIDTRIMEHPVFLTQKSVLQYSRFMSENHAIFKAYVPETAIEGHSQKLVLKKGLISRTNVHGCFLTLQKNREYHANPYFNESLAS